MTYVVVVPATMGRPCLSHLHVPTTLGPVECFFFFLFLAGGVWHRLASLVGHCRERKASVPPPPLLFFLTTRMEDTR